jgi:DNA-binding response OmpR family regulator
MRVLAVDDVASTRQMVRYALELEGFVVVEAASATEALRLVGEDEFGLALVDLGLPDMPGLELVAALRRLDPDVHLIIVSGADSETERVRGLIGGADDYVVKPFSVRELTARAVAVDRRRTADAARMLRFGRLVIDLEARAVALNGEAVDLTRREFDLLSYLAHNPSRTITRAQLLETAWSSSAAWQSESTVTEHVRRLRCKLETNPSRPRRIVTVRGVGYRFEQPDDGDDADDADDRDAERVLTS